MYSNDEAEKLVRGVGQWSLCGDNPSSSSELPNPISVEIATACVYPRTIVGNDVHVSIAEVIFWGTTEGSRVIICRIGKVSGGGDV